MTTNLTVLVPQRDDRDRLRAALTGIATYSAAAREQIRGRPAAQIIDDVLRNIEQHANEVLDGQDVPRPPLTIPAGTQRPAGRWPVALTAARCAELLRDPPAELERVAIVEVLSVVPELGPHGARRLLREHRIAHTTWLGARTWTRLADQVASTAGARA